MLSLYFVVEERVIQRMFANIACSNASTVIELDTPQIHAGDAKRHAFAAGREVILRRTVDINRKGVQHAIW